MQARAPLWGANVGRIFTQKTSRPRSRSFTRARKQPLLRSTAKKLNTNLEGLPIFSMKKLTRPPLHSVPQHSAPTSFGSTSLGPHFIRPHLIRLLYTTTPTPLPNQPCHRTTYITGPNDYRSTFSHSYYRTRQAPNQPSPFPCRSTCTPTTGPSS
jgi:hypothetical protein